MSKKSKPRRNAKKASKPDQTVKPTTGPDIEVPAKPTRRKFSAEDKARILALADACPPGELGALLRREGLYSSHLSKWRKQRAEGALTGLTPKKRGRKPQPQHDLEAENRWLREEVTKLDEELRKAAVIIDIQKKVAMLLGVPVKAYNGDES